MTHSPRAIWAPPTIPDWDDWWVPSGDNITHIQMLMAHEETTDLSNIWIMVGSIPFPTHICPIGKKALPQHPDLPTEGGIAPSLSSESIAVHLPFTKIR
jgi:hypothetical protein